MSSDYDTYCNGRTDALDSRDEYPKAEPGPHAGDGYCERPAGWGTSHSGEGRCKLHGGANVDGGRPPSHGLYSFKREELEEKYREAYSEQDWADLRAEIAAVRALLSDYLEGMDAVDSDGIADVTKLIAELRRLTGDLQEMLHRERLTREEEEKLFNTFATILRDYVPESDRDQALDALEQAVSAGSGRPALEGSSG
jgi:hypothetical protein